MTEEIFARLQAGNRLPSPPGAALRVLELAAREDSPITEIADVIGADPALSSRILRFANSPMAGIGRAVGSIQQAVTMLGLRSVKMLSLGFSLVSDRTAGQCAGFSFGRFWRGSLACATFSRKLAHLDREVAPEEAFSAGLLANIGRLALAVGAAEQYARIMSRADAPLKEQIEAERKAFGTTHMELGARLLESWHLPEPIWKAVEQARATPEHPEQAGALQRVLYVADELARRLILPDEPRLEDLQYCRGLVEQYYGLEEHQFQELFDAAGKELSQLGEVLSVEVGTARSLGDLQARAQEQMLQLSLAAQLENRQVRRENEALQQRVRVDALTQVGNREAFDEQLATEISRASRSKKPLALIILDVDHFKGFNDTYGHQAGDLVLRTVAQHIKSCVRKMDFVARYGGEEFGVVAPEAGSAGAKVLAERIRTAVERARAEFEGQALQVTASLGVAVWDPTDWSGTPIRAADLIKRSDACLYQAKKAGRNRVEATQITAERDGAATAAAATA
jgi:diguanylate cyclase (GGDEF)-like protein